MAFDRADFARASALYSRLVDLDESVRPEIEPRRQKAILMAAENLLRLAAEAEKEGRAGDAERLYRDAGAHPTAVEKAPEHAAEVDTDAEARRKTAELEDLGRWGGDIGRFRKMEASETITREEFAALVVRYFPDLVEFRQTPRAATDISNSWAAAEIQTVLGLGITDLERDSEFNPTRTITRGALCQALSSLAHIVGVFSWEVRPDPLPDVAFGDPLLGDAQWALASGLLVADKSGELRPHAEVSGREAVIAVDRLASELRKKGINTPSFQQQP
jgi:hypothetical protein